LPLFFYGPECLFASLDSVGGFGNSLADAPFGESSLAPPPWLA
jgi:hypothetical protein